MRMIKNLFSLIAISMLLSGCFLFPNDRKEAEKHRNVCLIDEIAVIDCTDPFLSLTCHVDCYPNNDRVDRCIELISKTNTHDVDIIEVIKECKSPITRWK